MQAVVKVPFLCKMNTKYELLCNNNNLLPFCIGRVPLTKVSFIQEAQSLILMITEKKKQS